MKDLNQEMNKMIDNKFYTYWQWLGNVKNYSDEYKMKICSDILLNNKFIKEYREWLKNNEK